MLEFWIALELMALAYTEKLMKKLIKKKQFIKDSYYE